MNTKRIGKSTLRFGTPPIIVQTASIVGKKEGEGPLGAKFDYVSDDSHFGKDSWESAESNMQFMAVQRLLNKSGLSASQVDFIVAGDLLNQCTGSSYGLRNFALPFMGLYGACSTFAEALALSAITIDGGFANRCIAVTSSHFCAAERQFRTPLDYGGQRPQSAQWTVTGSGAVLIECGSMSIANTKSNVKIIHSVIGTVTDSGVTDANNMGGAMAPACAKTIKQFFDDTQMKPSDFDMIVTGDLGVLGSEMMLMLLEKEGISITNHSDCGLMIYDESQDVHSGGSGCGCSATVMCSKIIDDLQQGNIHDVLFIATGALMSPTIILQGEDIASIAHLVHLSSK